MLNPNDYLNEELKDNTIVVNGKKFMVTDTVCDRIFKILLGKEELSDAEPQQTAKQSKRPLTTTEENTPNVTCHWKVEDVIDAKGKKFYRIVDGIFTAGKWYQSKYNPNEEVRFPTNQEAHKLAMDEAKAIEGIQCTEMNGGWKAYGFTSKAKATKAIENLPSKIDGKQIARYIAEHGKIPVEAKKRIKPESK